jgi:alcohol dehydrogenase
MRQLWLAAKNNLEWRDVKIPVIDGPGQAIVSPLSIARCDLDLPMLHGNTLMRPAFPVGHEMTGRIVSLSDDVTNLSIGENCVVNFQIVCGTCPSCLSQHSPACETVPFASHYGLGRDAVNWGGGISELVKIPYAKAMLKVIPDGLDPLQLASLSDNMTDALRTVAPYLKTKPDSSILIIGGFAESISCYAIQFAKALGSPRIGYFDTDMQRCEFAKTLGAEVFSHGKYLTRLEGEWDVTIDCSGSMEGFHMALRSARPYGNSIGVSMYFNNKTPIPYLEMYNKGITFTVGRTHGREQTSVILDLIIAGKFSPELVTSSIVNFEDAAEAWKEPGRKLIVKGYSAP